MEAFFNCDIINHLIITDELKSGNKVAGHFNSWTVRVEVVYSDLLLTTGDCGIKSTT
jgi:hypothetical protein